MAHSPWLPQPYFKLICGANLRDLGWVERLSCLYALAGAALVDVAAEPNVASAAVRGLAQAKQWRLQPPAWLEAAYEMAAPPQSAVDAVVMVSITLAGDRHTQIAVVDSNSCIACDLCTPTCPPGSIINGVVEDRICTGCGLCLPACPVDVIRLLPREVDPDLEACWAAGARALEIHTGRAAAAEVAGVKALADRWQAKGGRLAYSIDGQALGFGGALALAKQVAAPGLILQADGKPISATSGLRSTVPAVRLARAMLQAGLPGLIQAAGGANDQTGPLARRFGVALAGVGMGSFARALVSALQHPEADDADWAQSYLAARRLVCTVTHPTEALPPRSKVGP